MGILYKPSKARFMPDTQPWTWRVATSIARKHLSEIVTRVQDPRSYCVLTRHGKPVAAIVPMKSLTRIHDLEDIEDIATGKTYPTKFRFGKNTHWCTTQKEAAEQVLKTQMDRKTEREVLKNAGLEPIPGGELVMDVDVATPVKRRWVWPWTRKSD